MMNDSNGGKQELSEEDMLGVLAQLSEMKASQPEVFKKFLSSLGMGEDTDLLSNGEEGIRKMTESIMKMRGEARDGSADGGISLSKDGNKLVSSHIIVSGKCDFLLCAAQGHYHYSNCGVCTENSPSIRCKQHS